MPGADPARKRIEQDLASAEFEAGVGAGHWRLLTLEWPCLKVTVTCGDGNELGLRIMTDDYPRLAPAGRPWDLPRDQALPTELWPEGGTVPQVFRRDWSPSNEDAPYLACDRKALVGHNWAQEHPDRAWHARRTISFYLSEIHRGLRGTTLPPSGTNQ